MKNKSILENYIDGINKLLIYVFILATFALLVQVKMGITSLVSLIICAVTVSIGVFTYYVLKKNTLTKYVLLLTMILVIYSMLITVEYARVPLIVLGTIVVTIYLDRIFLVLYNVLSITIICIA